MKKTLVLILLILISIVVLTGCARPQNDSQWQNVTVAPEFSFNTAGNDAATEGTSREESNLPEVNTNTEPVIANGEESETILHTPESQKENITEITPQLQTPSVEKESRDQYSGSPVGIFHSIEEFIEITKNNKNDIVFQSKESGGSGWIHTDYFYLPKLPEEYKLVRIRENASVLTFFFTDEDKEEITVNFRKATSIKKETLLEDFLQQTKRNSMSNAYITEDGYIYDQNQKQITILTQNSWINICVPESMNTYEQLKPLCVATRYEVNQNDNTVTE